MQKKQAMLNASKQHQTGKPKGESHLSTAVLLEQGVGLRLPCGGSSSTVALTGSGVRDLLLTRGELLCTRSLSAVPETRVT